MMHHQDLAERGLVHPADPGEPSTGLPRVSITDEEAALLSALARRKWVLELGTGLGVSTCALARTAAKVVTIDIDPWVHENIWPDLPGNVQPQKRRARHGAFDMAFIDAEHTDTALRADVAYAIGLLHPGDFLVLHDADELARTIAELPGKWWKLTTMYGMALSVVENCSQNES